jgi:hypothetical protein
MSSENGVVALVENFGTERFGDVNATFVINKVLFKGEIGVARSEGFAPFSVRAICSLELVQSLRIVECEGGERRDGNGIRRSRRFGGKNVLGVVWGKKCLIHREEDVIPFFRCEVRASRRSVGRILCTGQIVELKVEFRQKHRPSHLAAVKNAGGHEIFEVFMIRNDGNGCGGADEPGAHVAEAVNDGEKFLVMNLVIDFCGRKFAGVKCNGVKIAVGIRLEVYTSHREVGGVGMESGRETGIEMAKYGSGGKSEFELFESVSSSIVDAREIKFGILGREGG